MDLNLGAPFDMISPIVVVEIESRLGRVEEVEKRQRRDAHNLFMHVKVAILVAKLIRRGGFVVGSNGQRTWVTFKYKCLPMFCHWCRLLRHDLKHCALYFGVTKNGEKGDIPIWRLVEVQKRPSLIT